MPAQKREPRNYIGLVNDEADQPCAARTQAQISQPMKDFIRSLLAVVIARSDRCI